MLKKLFYLCSLSLLASAVLAHADPVGTTETFTLNQGGSCCGSGPFGTIVLDQISSTTVSVTETLVSTDFFVITGAGHALQFNLTGDPAVTITFTGANSADFSVGPTGDMGSPFGTFDYSVVCNKPPCANGSSASSGPNPLSFDVTDTAGVSISDFISNGDTFFASDINVAGSTGNVAVGPGTITPPPPSTPEPSSLLLLGTGIFAAALYFRQRSAQSRV